MKISVIMPSYLGTYEGSADNLPKKFRRAVNSVLKQTYTNFELIVISDGCQQTNKILKTEYQKYLQAGIIKLVELPRHEPFTGSVRQSGIDRATGDVFCNLDADDELVMNHLRNLSVAFDPKKYSWCYFNLYRKLDVLKDVEELIVTEPNLDSLCTANVAWKKGLDVTWTNCDGRQDNKAFNKQLLDKYPNHTKIFGCGYIIRHANFKHVEN